jgi:hypothetical protein
VESDFGVVSKTIDRGALKKRTETHPRMADWFHGLLGRSPMPPAPTGK